MTAADGSARPPDELCARLGITLPDDLLVESLTHRSYAYEHGGLRPNERLEFLGDAVLGVVITDALFTRNPDLPEGRLAKMRAAVVSAKALASVAREIDLGAYLLLGKGEDATGGRNKTSILADSLEAVLGAVYLTAGLTAATEVIHRLMDSRLTAAEGLDAELDWKTSLQELTSELGLGAPQYVVAETGPDHDKVFTAQVKLTDGLHGHGRGPTKKDAEQQAARTTFAEISENRR
ncbi:MAG: ribonuclease III [Candidatus Nanopelagicales bacterium]